MNDEISFKINDIFLDISKSCNDMVRVVKKIDKMRKKELKNISKDTDKSKASINIKRPISKNLSFFMKIDNNTLISKSEALKYISQYIKNNNLQLNENKKKFLIDDNLSNLFEIEKNEIKTFMNINGLISKHFTLN